MKLAEECPYKLGNQDQVACTFFGLQDGAVAASILAGHNLQECDISEVVHEVIAHTRAQTPKTSDRTRNVDHGQQRHKPTTTRTFYRSPTQQKRPQQTQQHD